MTKMPKPITTHNSNISDAVKTAAYWKLLKKTPGATKVNRQAHQLKKDDNPYNR